MYTLLIHFTYQSQLPLPPLTLTLTPFHSHSLLTKIKAFHGETAKPDTFI